MKIKNKVPKLCASVTRLIQNVSKVAVTTQFFVGWFFCFVFLRKRKHTRLPEMSWAGVRRVATLLSVSVFLFPESLVGVSRTSPLPLAGQSCSVKPLRPGTWLPWLINAKTSPMWRHASLSLSRSHMEGQRRRRRSKRFQASTLMASNLNNDQHRRRRRLDRSVLHKWSPVYKLGSDRGLTDKLHLVSPWQCLTVTAHIWINVASF